MMLISSEYLKTGAEDFLAVMGMTLEEWVEREFAKTIEWMEDWSSEPSPAPSATMSTDSSAERKNSFGS